LSKLALNISLLNSRSIFIQVKNQSDKKTFQNFLSNGKSTDCIDVFVASFKSLFQVARHNQTLRALQYIQGLLTLEKGKANMERMEEEIPKSEYRAYQHFITDSKWDHQAVLSKVAKDTSDVLQANKAVSKQPVGLIVDESGHLKKGEKSVAVSKQYAGVVGKVENCQVGVYVSLVNDNRAALVDERLFIPQKWIKDKQRCEKAGIPKEQMVFKTKPELALEMIDQKISDGIEFDWIGGDGLYGHNRALREGMDKRGLFYVLDVHKDEKIFTSCPAFAIPERTGKQGRPPQKPQPDIAPIRLDAYIKQLTKEDWVVENQVRKTHKGWKKLKIHTKTIWVFQGEGQEVSEQTLIITQTMDGTKDTKFSFSNGKLTDYSPKEYAYFQVQRYWVERTFDDAKNELGMSDYQVRKWNGWHHHHSLVFMAGLFLLQQKIVNQEESPLMSVRDARILVVIQLFGTQEEMEIRLAQMKKRHLKRQKDIDRRCRNQNET
jgi:SRSO17 transposase